MSDLYIEEITNGGNSESSRKEKLTDRKEAIKSDIDLGNVDNTADADKPVSTDIQAELDGKAVNAATVTQAEAEAGTITTIRRWTPQRIKQAILALGGGGFQPINVGPKGAVYSGIAGWAFVGDEICWQTPDGTSSTTYWSFVVPSNYSGGGKIEIWTRRQNAAEGTMKAFINNVIDSTIDVLTIKPVSALTWEKITLTFGSTIAGGDVINLEMVNDTTGSGTRLFQTKAITFN